MTMLRQLWQHIRTGEVYAVELRGAAVVGACGPLDYLEQRADLLPHMLYEAELGKELDARQTMFTLARQPPEKRTTMRWSWKELQRWLIHNRPRTGIGTINGVKGWYSLDKGPESSFVPCGYTWREVAVRLGATRKRRK